MTDPGSAPTTSVSGTITGVSGQAAIGTNIRQNAVFLTVEIASGDPAALERVAEQIRLDPIPDPVMASGRDVPSLIGREDAVSAAREALRARRSVSTFGADGIGKTVFLRHLARRVDGFVRGVALVPSGGMLWQDIGNEIVRAFFTASLPIYLGPTQLRTVLAPLDALVLLDDVDAGAKVDQLFALMENASFVVAAPERLLAGETRAVPLRGLDPAGTAALIGDTLANLGETADVEPEVAERIGTALDGHPGRIIRMVEDASGRGLDLAGLAAELEAGVAGAAEATVHRLSATEQDVVYAVAALDGAPVGPEHVAAVVPGATADEVEGLVERRILRVASPQVRLDSDVAATIDETSHADESRRRFVDHIVEWVRSSDPSAADVAAESRAILELLDWAERTDRPKDAHALAVATESAFALANRWGTWAQVTGYRLRAARALDLPADEAIALNQLGVQALAEDAAPRARELFVQAHDLAVAAQAPGVAETAARNIEVIDAPLMAPPNDTEPRPDPIRTGWKAFLRPLLVVGLVVVAALILWFLFRPALAIEPASRVFEPASVDSDGEQVTFTVSNRGLTTLEALSVGLSGDAAGEFFIVSGDCPGRSLGSGQSCTVVLLFHPSRAGAGQATLTISSRDGTVASASIQSTAAGPSIEPTPSETPSQPPPSNTPSPPVDALPDLAIRRFVPTDQPTFGDFILIPVEVIVVNAGDEEAGPFPIVITADRQPVPFEVEGVASSELVTQAPLGPNDSVTYNGLIQLARETPLDRVRLVVEADSCANQPDAPPECRIAEPNEANNSLALQVVDLQVANVILGEPRDPPGEWDGDPPWADVDVSFDLLNTGTEPAGDFWIAAFLGQIRADLHSDTVEYDQVRTMLHVPSLAVGADLHVDAVAMVPSTSLGSQMQIVIGCPPLSDPCSIPEIAFDNNWTSVDIPPRPTPEPTQ